MLLTRYRGALVVSVLVGSACAAGEATTEKQQLVSLADRIAACASDPRVVAGMVSTDVCVGADLFLRETFGGNGRSCATCHRVDGDFAIDPGFLSTLPANDPLFVAEFDPDLAGLEVPEQMRRFGLILENVDGFAPDPSTHFVLRSVPHTLSMATSVKRATGDLVTPPIDRTGWSGDGAPGTGTLRDFQTGAITQHYTSSLARVVGEDFRLADDEELDRIEAYMRQLGRTNEIVLASAVMVDRGAEAGRARFLTIGCNACHTNAGANAAFGGGGNRNFNTGVENARHPALAAFPRDGGFLSAPANADGSFGNGAFNTPPLIEAADTGPFFHTAVSITGASGHNADVASTIEEAIAFYDSPAFNNSPAGRVVPIDLTATEIDNIGRFLRGVNATFNTALAIKRLDAAAAIVAQFQDAHLEIQRELLRLADVEMDDAIRMLSEVPELNGGAKRVLVASRLRLAEALAANAASLRAKHIESVRVLARTVSTNVGTNLIYDIGAGTVMF
jgi:mono/diheme cytochrome c family protein